MCSTNFLTSSISFLTLCSKIWTSAQYKDATEVQCQNTWKSCFLEWLKAMYLSKLSFSATQWKRIFKKHVYIHPSAIKPKLIMISHLHHFVLKITMNKNIEILNRHEKLKLNYYSNTMKRHSKSMKVSGLNKKNYLKKEKEGDQRNLPDQINK